MAATACVLQSIPPSTALLYRPRPNQISLPRRLRICKSSSNDDAPPSPVAAPGPEPVQIRFRGVSKKRRRKMMEEEESESQLMVKEQAPPKKWEEMTVGEGARAVRRREGTALLAQQVRLRFHLHRDRSLDSVPLRRSGAEPLPARCSAAAADQNAQGFLIISTLIDYFF